MRDTRYRRRRCRRRSPSAYRQESCGDWTSLVPVLFLLPLLLVCVLIVFDLILILEVLVVIIIIVVFVGRRVELEGGKACHFEVGSAFGAAQKVPFIDVIFVDFNLGIT